MKEELILKAYEIAKERYAALGIDTDKVLEQLQEGDVLVLCCDRSGALDLTLRRLFGLSDGFIKGAR